MNASINRFPGRSGCPIATSLDILGDKWTLVIVRDLVNGKSKFGEFMASPEAITTNILSDRLKRMETHALISAKQYQDNPPRYQYELTTKGLALHPVLQELCRWANDHIEGTWVPPPSFMKKSPALGSAGATAQGDRHFPGRTLGQTGGAMDDN